MCNYRYPDFLTQEQELERRKRDLKLHLNSLYGQLVYADTDSIYTKENDMRINDFIVLHSDNQPLIIKKDSIETLSRLSDGSARVETTNQIWITGEKYVDVIKRLFE